MTDYDKIDALRKKGIADAAKKAKITNQCFVVLMACGNVDFRQSINEPFADTEMYPINNFQQAVNHCMSYIIDNDLGGGNWLGGQVINPKGEILAEISYNGRVWKNNTEVLNLKDKI